MIKGTVYPVEGARIPIQNPYILVGHHTDNFPKGNGEMAPIEFPSDWIKGNDFSKTRGWKMYHGQEVPGFPAHPHRGFETITYAKKGMIDHFDSHGNYGRYGDGDIQWMISGKGLQHAEMFPLIETEKENPFEIVQIWLNLPSAMKMVEPSYKMHWQEKLPVVALNEKKTEKNYLKVLAGRYKGVTSVTPKETSYGHNPAHYINIWDGKIEKGNELKIEAFPEDVAVQVYVFKGEVEVDGHKIAAKSLFVYTSDEEVTLVATKDTEFMVFTGKEIKEEIVAYGPFVMNTRQEIVEAYEDFEINQFGGWPWENDQPKIEADKGRFSVFNKGSEHETP